MNHRTTPWRIAPVALSIAMLLSACGNSDPQKMVESAREYLDKKDNAAAIIQLKNALQEKPELAEARFLLGKALLANGDPVGSQTELQKALDLGYAADEVTPLLARSRLLQGQFAGVTKDYAAVQLGSAESNATLRTLVAVAWRQQGNQDAFQKSLQEALAAKPDHEPALIEQARLKASQRDFDGALGGLAALLAKSPKNEDALKLRGDILLYGKNQPDQALAAYRESTAARPKFQEGQGGVVRVLLSQGKLDEAAKEIETLKAFAAGYPQTLNLQAQLALQKNELPAAREHAQQLLKLTPSNPTALELAGSIEYQLNSMTQAEALLARAVQAAPQLRVARRVLVLTYLRTGQVDRAIAALPADIATNDSDPALLSVAGQVHMVKGDVELAQQFFSRASRLDPTDPTKRTTLALSQMATGNAESALGALQDIASSDAGVVADMALINAHMRRRDVDKALVAIDGLQKKRANDPLPHQLRGRALLLRNDRTAARSSFEQALKIDPAYFAATAALAALDIVDRKPQEAQQRMEAVLKTNPSNAQALMALAEIKAGSGAGKQEVIDLIQKAIDAVPTDKTPRLMLVEYHLRQNDAKAALTTAQSAAVALPDVPELVDALGRAQAANGENNQAMSSFNKLVGLMPQSPLPYLRMAAVHVAAKDNSAAITSLRKALDAQPNLLAAQRGLAELLLKSNQTSEAVAISKTVQTQRPKENAGFLLEGDVHSTSRNWASAAAAYQAGLKVAPGPELVIKLHTALTQSGKAADAQRLTTEWLRTNPNDAAIPLYLGDRAIASNQLNDAQRQYDRVLALQPNNALALNNMAWVAGKLGRADALTLAEKANEVAPNQPAFMDTLALLLSEKNEHARALTLQKKVVELQPNAPLFKLNLAKIHIKAGDKASAKPLLDELTALGDKFSGQAEVTQLKGAL